MASNEIVSRAAAKARLLAREIRLHTEHLLAIVSRANVAATTLELMAAELDPTPDTPEADRSSHRS